MIFVKVQILKLDLQEWPAGFVWFNWLPIGNELSMKWVVFVLRWRFQIKLKWFDRFCQISRLLETSKFSELSLEQLVEKLAESDDLEEQTDILHYLVLCFGLKQKITVPNVS